MKIKEIRQETDWQGEKKVIEQSNGICIKVQHPSKLSPEYKEILKKRADKEKERMQIEKETQEREKLIQAKMREIAIRELGL